MSDVQFRELILASLREQGFEISESCISLPADWGKDELRNLHATAVNHRRKKAESGLRRFESSLLSRVARGTDLDPARIQPRLVRVEAGTEDELFFRYASLHWSIPTSAGYGRRLRYLVIDDSNGKVMGVFGLGDPVYSLGPRDRWVGWGTAARRERLHHVVDAFLLGAVPPYNFLVGAKLIAMLTASREVHEAFEAKYSARTSRISNRSLSGKLALITTTSALGRSSVYNRVCYRGRKLFQNVGYTRGSGEFHFANGTYAAIREYALAHCVPTAKNAQWGSGFRNRREVIKKVLKHIGLPTEFLYHQVKREIFVVPLARNAAAFLRGEGAQLDYYNVSAAEHFEWFRERWLLSRATREISYREWEPEAWRLWP